MKLTSENAPLAPFRVPSFRFQWPSDLLTSWAFEMETLILGWYILVATDSVLWLTVFASLQFLGTLVAPAFGLGSDRLGRRRMLCAMRATYMALAGCIMAFGFLDILNPLFVFIIAFLAGLIRPSDLVMRNALIGDTIPPAQLLRAMSISRTTMDSARIVGALAGAGLFSQVGISYAYLAVTAIYGVSLLLTFGVAESKTTTPLQNRSFWREMKEGLGYVRRTPTVLAIMWLAFLVNLTAYPLAMGLLPYVAKDVYHIDENGLGHIVAAYALGALAGSIFIILTGGWRRPAQLMLLGIWGWYVVMLLLGFVRDKYTGMVLLLVIGFMQSLAMVSMSVALLHVIETDFRGRVLGVRMLAVYGLPLGILAAGPLITEVGYAGMVTIYCAIGLVTSLYVALRWQHALWHS